MDNCKYCTEDLNLSQSSSEWSDCDEKHYKSIKCSKGHKNWVKAPFHGSGHDSLSEREKTIQSLVRKVQEK